MPDPKADRAFFTVDAVKLSRRLLGSTLVRILPDGTRLSGRIVEVEAYLGPDDQGSHVRGGRRTPRNESMYAIGGTLYVYFTYGMHHCMNIVAGPAESPQAVLLRALEPLDGLAHMQARRGKTKPIDLCSGPAKLCKALDIDRAFNGVDSLAASPVFIEPSASPARGVEAGPRIGLSCGGRWAKEPLRFWLKSSDCVSV